MTKRIKMDVVAEGDVEVEVIGGNTPLYISREQRELLYRILTKCTSCENLTEEENQYIKFIVAKLKGISERIDV